MVEYALLLAQSGIALGAHGWARVQAAVPHSLDEAVNLAASWPGLVLAGLVFAWVLLRRPPGR